MGRAVGRRQGGLELSSGGRQTGKQRVITNAGGRKEALSRQQWRFRSRRRVVRGSEETVFSCLLVAAGGGGGDGGHAAAAPARDSAPDCDSSVIEGRSTVSSSAGGDLLSSSSLGLLLGPGATTPSRELCSYSQHLQTCPTQAARNVLQYCALSTPPGRQTCSDSGPVSGSVPCPRFVRQNSDCQGRYQPEIQW